MADSSFKPIPRPKPLGFTRPVRGRGAKDNPSGRFERLALDTEPETFNALLEAGAEEDVEKQIPTQVFRDTSRSIISTNDSPDVPEATLNPYRGCEHGCIYCYARPGHEYFGLSAGLDFESKIFVKPDAAQLLIKQLSAPSWRPKTLSLSGITDCYQPLERRLQVTRACLDVLRNFKNPAAIITKNALITRDTDILRDMAQFDGIAVNISITTLDAKLARAMEPRASTPSQRLKALETLSKANIPTGVIIGPVLPGLTEHEIPGILKAASEAGARWAHYTMLRLPYGVKDLFQSWLDEHYPERKEKVLNRLREMHNGKLYDSAFGSRMRGMGVHAEHIAALFALQRKRYGLTGTVRLSTAAFNREAYNSQLSLF
ncbi:MAG: PA0069 family radical SAM protein [Alphaproteobacteria bacterium]|nr:PA0069 family radical SAM protein [Alphaproteobacteria bacterium]